MRHYRSAGRQLSWFSLSPTSQFHESRTDLLKINNATHGIHATHSTIVIWRSVPISPDVLVIQPPTPTNQFLELLLCGAFVELCTNFVAWYNIFIASNKSQKWKKQQKWLHLCNLYECYFMSGSGRHVFCKIKVYTQETQYSYLRDQFDNRSLKHFYFREEAFHPSFADPGTKSFLKIDDPQRCSIQNASMPRN